jgi:solute carrier family 25 S-adenosylmethionine transporter 26
MKETEWYSHLLIGGLSRAVAVSITYPLDTLKTILQNNATHKGYAMHKGYDLYKGYKYTLATQAAYGMAVFGTYENIKRIWGANNPAVYLQSALISDLIGSVLLCPCEVIKQNIQIGRYASISSAVQNLKLHGLYKGYSGLLLRDLPFRVIQLPLYDTLKDKYGTSLYNSCIMGATAGMVAGAITTPTDVIKTHMMCSQEKKNIAQTIKYIYMKTGLLGFVAGLPARVMYLGGTSSVFFMSYETLKQYL